VSYCLQKAAFCNFGEELRRFALSNVASIDSDGSLYKYLSPLDDKQLSALAVKLSLIPEPPSEADEVEFGSYTKTYNKEFLLDLMVGDTTP